MDHGTFLSVTTTDIRRARTFYDGLGLHPDPAFTNEHGACWVLGGEQRLVVVERDLFASMTDKAVADPRTTAMIGLNVVCGSREEVDGFAERGLAAGGTEPRPASEEAGLYSRDLDDPDGNDIGFLAMSGAAPGAAD